MANCPLCSDVLLRHVRSKQTYWFCRRCRIEISEESEKIVYQPPYRSSVGLSLMEGASPKVHNTSFVSSIKDLLPHVPFEIKR